MSAIHTTLALPAETGLDSLTKFAASMGIPAERQPDRVEISARFGRIRAEAAAGGVALSVRSETPQALAALRGAIEGFISAAGLAVPAWQGDVAQSVDRTRLTLTRAVSVRQISPSFRRVRLEGDFAAFLAGPVHFRLVLGPEGAALPQPGADGALVWPGGIEAWHRPPYTVRALDPAGRWMEFDIFLHEGGRVTEWTEDLRPGDPVALTGPGGKAVRQAAWMGMAGDETALPVILRAIEAAGPETRGHALILVADAADAQPVATPPGLRLDWVPRSAGRSLLDLFRSLTPPEGERMMFFAGERAESRQARDHALSLGLQPAEIHAASYWTAGWVPPASQRQARRKG